MKAKILITIQIAIASFLLAACYPDDDEIFKQYASSFNDPSEYNPNVDSPSNNPCVDLGLSSRKLWAEYNIGASKASEIGELFLYSPYIVLQEWKDPWKQPSKTDFNELIKECKWEISSKDNITGIKITGPNENWLFLPFYESDLYGLYWTNNGSNSCFKISTSPQFINGDEDDRHPVRAIRASGEELEISKEHIIMPAEKSTTELNVTDTQGKVEIDNPTKWLTVKKTVDGISVSTNSVNNGSTQREGKFFLTSGLLKRVVHVTQDPEDQHLEISRSALTFTSAGGMEDVEISFIGSNIDINTSGCEWISTTLNGSTLKIKVEPNSVTDDREGNVVVQVSNQKKQIRISQSAAEKSPKATLSSVTTNIDEIIVKGTIDMNGATEKEHGILYTDKDSSIKPDLSLDNYKSISRVNSSTKAQHINITQTYNGNGYWYGNKNYYFFRIYVIATDGNVFYSDVSNGVIPTSR